MEQTKMLLLDFNPANKLGNTLREILESSFSPKIQFRQESVAALCDSDLSGIILRFHPDVIFFDLSPSLLRQTDTLCQFIKRESSEIPILVVIEEGANSEEMFELLKLGVADFITSPLKAIDVLPRVWRVLEWGRESESPIQRLKEKLGLKQLIGGNSAFLKEIHKIPLVAKCDVSILILGETGTG